MLNKLEFLFFNPKYFFSFTFLDIIVSVLFVGGIQLLSLGILSEYISKMYLEIKARPKYIIKEKIDWNIKVG